MFSLCLFCSHLSIRDLFIFAEYEILTALLVDTELRGNSLFWGMTRPAETAQLLVRVPYSVPAAIHPLPLPLFHLYQIKPVSITSWQSNTRIPAPLSLLNPLECHFPILSSLVRADGGLLSSLVQETALTTPHITFFSSAPPSPHCVTASLASAPSIGMPQFGSELWSGPEPSVNRTQVRSKIWHWGQTGPKVQFRVRGWARTW